ncbi:MAG: ABC transporter ATP-binding protein [Chloroflexi bacterium]|nr:ABC transporter ATP-binding protein [Chloroflexota bacterium]
MAHVAIMAQNLIKYYGSFQALRGIHLEVRTGEIFGFLGPNGSGKTTTIRCLLDLIHPTSGAVRVLNLDPRTDPVAVRARVGYLPGDLRLDENMTAQGALRYFSSLRGGRVDWSYVQQLARRLDLDLKQPIKNFSKGNKQKVGVIQALMHRPELLLLDEPTSGLDPLVQHEVLHLVAEARDAGATVFFSSHNLAEVEVVAGRVAIIRQGEIVEVSATKTLLERAIRRVRVHFLAPQEGNLEALERIPGVRVLDRDNGENILLQVEGDMDGLIKALAAYPVRALETERPSLEEIFLSYYESNAAGHAA